METLLLFGANKATSIFNLCKLAWPTYTDVFSAGILLL